MFKKILNRFRFRAFCKGYYTGISKFQSIRSKSKEFRPYKATARELDSYISSSPYRMTDFRFADWKTGFDLGFLDAVSYYNSDGQHGLNLLAVEIKSDKNRMRKTWNDVSTS